MLLDLQILTIFKHVKRYLPTYTGNVLDIGCGQSPYKFLLDKTRTRYYGIDVVEAGAFGYDNPEVTAFDGQHIPFADDMFTGIICTEVLEHVQGFQFLIDEMYRTAKKGADIIVTVPWSARYHYIPHDYFRYTPSSLKTMFSQFSSVTVQPRGTDIAVIGSKMIVLFVSGFFPAAPWKYIFLPIYIIALPLLALAVFMAHVAIAFGIGNDDDPLGYTIIIKK